MLKCVTELGFSYIDIFPEWLNKKTVLNQAQELQLEISCIAASQGMPGNSAFDSPDPEAADLALRYFKWTVIDGYELGADTVYVVPSLDESPSALNRFKETIGKAAALAAYHRMKLCLEHFPGRALPTVEATLDFIRSCDHDNIYLLFDLGHALLSGEDPVEAIRNAGPLLGYVHLNDNDGKEDLHLPLLKGILTESDLKRTFEALEEVGYTGAVSLELNRKLKDPYMAMKESKDIVCTLKEFV
jgi:sugar phosphate isomerase/epimerase